MTNSKEINLNGETLNLEQLEQVDGGFVFGALASSEKIVITGGSLARPLIVDSRQMALDTIALLKDNKLTEADLARLAFDQTADNSSLASGIFPIS